MHFSTLERSDLDDVQAINQAFLTYLSGADGEQLCASIPPELQAAVRALSQHQLQRLAAVPFLLLSFNEADEEYWQQPSRSAPTRDLFTPAHEAGDPLCQIATAAMSFLWQLARRNPYAARIVSGATPGWCEHLAGQTLMNMLERAVEEHHQLLLRCADDKIFWHRLLGAGVSSETGIRRAAHMNALQLILTPVAAVPARRFKTAACHSSVPVKALRSEPKPRQ